MICEQHTSRYTQNLARMTDFVAVHHDNRVAVITVQNPPVNALSPGVPEVILAALSAAESEAGSRPEVGELTVVDGTLPSVGTLLEFRSSTDAEGGAPTRKRTTTTSARAAAIIRDKAKRFTESRPQRDGSGSS